MCFADGSAAIHRQLSQCGGTQVFSPCVLSLTSQQPKLLCLFERVRTPPPSYFLHFSLPPTSKLLSEGLKGADVQAVMVAKFSF